MQVFFSIFWWIYFCVFFSGYPLVFALFYLLTKNKKLHHLIHEKVFSLLPLTYAFVGTCFWLLILYAGKIDFVAERIITAAPSSIVILYSIAALLFWLPVLREKTNLSFFHSLPLFLLPFFNMLLRLYKHKIVDHDYIVNLFRIYTAGFGIYIIAILFLLLVKWLLKYVIFRKASQKQ